MTGMAKWKHTHEEASMAADNDIPVKKCRRGMFMSWGANSYGQLANGNTDDMSSPSVIQDLPFTPSTMTGGGGHSLFVADSGQLFTCGWNNKGQLGLPQTTHNVYQPLLVEFFNTKKIHSVAGGWDHSLLCTDLGELYAWGSNAFGQLGCESIKTFTNIPTRVEVPEPVISVAAGLRHSLVLTATGKLYAWGSAKKGQLGVGQDDRPPTLLPKPHLVSFGVETSPVKQVVCGAYHSAAVTVSGDVFVWGDNKHGQMALPPTQQKSVICPQQVAALSKRVSRIRSGWTHLLAETSSGEVLSWGRNDFGQLGRQSAATEGARRADHHPAPIPGLKHPAHLVCGSEHNLAITADGGSLSWGWNEHGICGTGDEVDVHTPQQMALLSNFRVEVAGCGNGHSIVYGHAR